MNWQNEEIISEVKEELDKFAQNRFFLLGEYTDKFEKMFAKNQQSEFFIGLSSGTVALQLLLRSQKLPIGSKVLVTSFCPIPTVMSIYEAGLVPKFVDINPKTLNISVEELNRVYSKDCKAVIAVHIFGKMCEMEDISNWCKLKDIPLIEDACQAVNSKRKESSIGQHSVGAAMSFYPTKNLGAWGDAGGVITNSPEVREKLLYLRNYGLNSNFVSESLGGNYRMDELQALILLKKLPLQSKDMELRDRVLNFYVERLGKSNFQIDTSEDYHNKHVTSYLMNSNESREKYRSFCIDKGLKSVFFYEQPVYRHKGIKENLHLQNCEDVCSRIINLPTDEMRQDIVDFLKEIT